ncbi:MAG: hypothetical protein ACOVKV_11910, partial [Novosphingobium sp.]
VVVLRIRTGPDQRFAAGDTLPVGTSRVEIDYTATSLAVPERVRFRYRLVGGTGSVAGIVAADSGLRQSWARCISFRSRRCQ